MTQLAGNYAGCGGSTNPAVTFVSIHQRMSGRELTAQFHIWIVKWLELNYNRKILNLAFSRYKGEGW